MEVDLTYNVDIEEGTIVHVNNNNYLNNIALKFINNDCVCKYFTYLL